MDELIAQISAQQGYPADMVLRSAQARAQAQGVGVEDILRQWAGGEAAPAAAASPAPSEAETQPATTSAAPAAAEAGPGESEGPEESKGPEVEVLPPAEPAPPEDQLAEDEAEPVEERSGVLAGFPRWLAAAFVVVPMIAVLYAMLVPDGPDCGVSGQLALDPVSGEAVNCDGSEYGVEQVNLFSMGEELYDGRCAACHGGNGGGGAGPALAGGAVLATFPAGQCASHVEWIALGTTGWPEPTYGALAKPVGGFGVMPGFADSLTPEELAAVTLYERVAFGGEALPDAETDCAVAEDDAITAAP